VARRKKGMKTNGREGLAKTCKKPSPDVTTPVKQAVWAPGAAGGNSIGKRAISQREEGNSKGRVHLVPLFAEFKKKG